MTASPSPLSHLDHSVLQPAASWSELSEACLVAKKLQVASVCLLPYFVAEARRLLEGSEVRTSTVLAFPHGSTSQAAKLAEAEHALRAGAQELDVVTNLSLIHSGRWTEVEAEVRALTEFCHAQGAQLKWIFEMSALEQTQKLRLAELCSQAGVDWVKTSTGYGTHGASLEDVRLLRKACPSHVQVKASGGIRTLAEVRSFLSLGASRIGTSRTLAIAEELQLEAGHLA